MLSALYFISALPIKRTYDLCSWLIWGDNQDQIRKNMISNINMMRIEHTKILKDHIEYERKLERFINHMIEISPDERHKYITYENTDWEIIESD